MPAADPSPLAGPAIDASVLVPVFNEERYIEATVGAMRGQRFDGTLEFVFADGGSTDGTCSILAQLAAEDPRIRVFANPRRTVSSGLNVALREARGRWVARMDAHTVYPDDYLRRGVQRLADADTRWVSGPQIPSGHGRVSRAVSLALRVPLGRGSSRKWASGTDLGTDEINLDTGVFTGVWERSTLLQYGGWDERWVVNEDSELAARFLANGERLVCLPAMGGVYVPRDTLPSLWSQYRRYGRYRARTSRYHPESMRASHLLAPAVVICTGATVVAPRRVRRVALLAEAVYAATLAIAGMSARAAASPPSDAILVPFVLAAMHGAHGAGQIEGWFRYGPPRGAVASLTGLSRPAPVAPNPDSVFAPSLRMPRVDAGDPISG